MLIDEETTKNKIRDYIRVNGGKNSEWYVGITNDPKTRRIAHNAEYTWIDVKTESADVARRVEEYFISVLKTSGGGGDSDIRFVYAYKKGPHTREDTGSSAV